jgi:hypothetical protein
MSRDEVKMEVCTKLAELPKPMEMARMWVHFGFGDVATRAVGRL